MASPPAGIDPDFAALLCCPNCPDRPALRVDADLGALVCPCPKRRVYPVIDGIPDLRPDDQQAPAPAAVR